MLDGIKKWHIYLHLIKNLNYLIHVWILLIIFSLLGNGTIGLCTLLVDLSVSDSSDLEELGLDEVDA